MVFDFELLFFNLYHRRVRQIYMTTLIVKIGNVDAKKVSINYTINTYCNNINRTVRPLRNIRYLPLKGS